MSTNASITASAAVPVANSSAERRVRDALIATLAAGTVSSRTIHLTASQEARVAVFELRTGLKIEDVILDVLDDTVFDISRD